ncbi:unnamed protein product [Peniophora sp. CBMAI 1063]|nr:unnamed protein product [Peniophora sp. CBMAI 1063]
MPANHFQSNAAFRTSTLSSPGSASPYQTQPAIGPSMVRSTATSEASVYPMIVDETPSRARDGVIYLMPAPPHAEYYNRQVRCFTLRFVPRAGRKDSAGADIFIEYHADKDTTYRINVTKTFKFIEQEIEKNVAGSQRSRSEARATGGVPGHVQRRDLVYTLAHSTTHVGSPSHLTDNLARTNSVTLAGWARPA